MTDKYDDWIKDAPLWRCELEAAVAAHKGAQFSIPYSQVAFAFPSRVPYARSLENPRIDDETLRSWAEANNLRVELINPSQTTLENQ